MVELSTQIGRLSDGRVVFDARRRRLALRDDSHGELEVEVSEVDLRNWLQRLLLTTPHEGGREPQEAAVLLLLARLDTARQAPEPRRALLQLVG
jgi:hypothetical protein